MKSNIVILGLKGAKCFKHTACLKTQGQQHTSSCFVSYYLFHNYLYSLLNTTINTQIVFCIYKKNVYLVTNYNQITPYLTNLPLGFALRVQDTTTSTVDLWNILNHYPINLEISVALYSLFGYKNQLSSNHLKHNTIGSYQGKTSVIHLLLTPSLSSFQFYLSVINTDKVVRNVNLLNNLSMAHQAESLKIKFSPHQSENVEEALNEEYCICEHSQTQHIPRKVSGQYSSLGNTFI